MVIELTNEELLTCLKSFFSGTYEVNEIDFDIALDKDRNQFPYIRSVKMKVDPIVPLDHLLKYPIK